jgi:hypothetical protein
MIPILSEDSRARFLQEPERLMGTAWIVADHLFSVSSAQKGRVVLSAVFRTIDVIPEQLIQDGLYVGSSIPAMDSVYVCEPRDAGERYNILRGALCCVSALTLTSVHFTWVRWTRVAEWGNFMRQLTGCHRHIDTHYHFFTNFRRGNFDERREGAEARTALWELRHSEETIRRIADRSYVEPPVEAPVNVEAPAEPTPTATAETSPQTAWDRLNADDDLVSDAKP